MHSFISELRLRIVIAAIAGCGFKPSVAAQQTPDAPIVISDGGPCDGISTECVSADVMRSCSGPGALPTDATCDWGCVADAPAHCGVLAPAGGAVTTSDLAGTLDATIALSIDTGDGNNMKPKVDGVVWMDYRLSHGIAVLRFHRVHVTGPITIGGALGVAIVASDTVTIDGLMDTPMCGPPDAVGGFVGGHGNGSGSGGGAGGTGNSNGGGGGGNGGVGGGGGGGATGGSAFGANDLAVAVLVGGGAGGGGGGGGNGGRGGAAIQIVSNKSIAISTTGAINAGGCGGMGSPDHSGAGGGAGGTILIEAPTISIAGVLAVNGGGGGAGAGTSAVVQDGSRGTVDRVPALGGLGVAPGAIGAAGASPDGGSAPAGASSGGGGGGIGRIRLDTAHGVVDITNATLSPSLDDQPTTCTQATAAVQ